ncbi:hypothetical protein QJH64_002296 [Escherichia coli]|nr:hypothetical protein [Escherichia coli]
MKIILLFLAALASFTVHAQPPSQTVEQTVRQIYQNYKSDASTPYFGETGERAITSARMWGSDQFWTECEQPGRTCKP